MSLAVHPGGLVVTLVWLPPQCSSPHPAYTQYYSHGTHQYPIYSVWMSSGLFPVQWGYKWWRRLYKSKHAGCMILDVTLWVFSPWAGHRQLQFDSPLTYKWVLLGRGGGRNVLFDCMRKQDPPQGYLLIFRKRAAAPFLPISENNTCMTNTTKW